MLARLTELALDSRARLKAIEPLVPAALLPHIQPGPIDEKGWCNCCAPTTITDHENWAIKSVDHTQGVVFVTLEDETGSVNVIV